jgi:hypothetical protein
VSYIVKMVQGATRSMLIDHAYLLESHFAHELPETLIGAIRCVAMYPLHYRHAESLGHVPGCCASVQADASKVYDTGTGCLGQHEDCIGLDVCEYPISVNAHTQGCTHAAAAAAALLMLLPGAQVQAPGHD